eukprot:Nk52_evm72s210 gene=Nk52_evmTU72s210
MGTDYERGNNQSTDTLDSPGGSKGLPWYTKPKIWIPIAVLFLLAGFGLGFLTGWETNDSSSDSCGSGGYTAPLASQQVRDFISSMTVEEKVGQMMQLDVNSLMVPGTNSINETMLAAVVSKYKVGSILNAPCATMNCQTTPEQYQTIINAIQGAALNKNGGGNGIPILYGIDTVHGAQYVHGAAIFPQQLATASSFNTSHSYVMGVTGAKDTRAAGIPWVFSPILGVSSHALWPRNYETFGEDPLLVTEMGKAVINGYQGVNGSGLNTTEKVAACMKHFVGYPYPLNGMDRGPVRMPDSELMNIYVPSFEGAVEVNVASAMSGYHTLNDEPLGGSQKYLDKLLREVMGFDNMMVTDYGVIEELQTLHHMVPTFNDSVVAAMGTSIDMSMAGWNPSFYDALLSLVKDGKVPESKLDEAVGRILTLKEKVGWNLKRYEQPNWAGNAASVGSTEDWENSLEAARDSVILAKNSNFTLPFNQSISQSVLFTGPAIKSAVWQSGGWTLHWQGALSEDEFPTKTTVYDYVEQQTNAKNSNIKVSYSTGLNSNYSDYNTTVNEAVSAAKTSDMVVIGIGEAPYAEREGNINDGRLDEQQQSLVRAIQAVNSKVVLVLFEGRPRILDDDIVANSMAVIVSFFPGPMGGQAVGEALLGTTNPNAAMPITYPAATNQIPYRFWHKWSYDAYVQDSGSDMCTLDCFASPLYEFGHGLSYTTFAYSDLKTDSPSYKNNAADLSVKVSVVVKNVGNLKGKHPVLLFVSDLYRAKAAPEYKLLKGFEKIELEAGAEKTVEFVLDRKAFQFHTADDPFGATIIEDGDFTLTAGVGNMKKTATITLTS